LNRFIYSFTKKESYYEETLAKPLPFGITMVGASGTDGKVFDIAKAFEATPYTQSTTRSEP
jgi:Asp-tRNA(Asn)/Glu-tRNA(Gln) amidotransferase A subunit family amidase